MPASPRKRVLLVDDDVQCLALLKKGLEARNFACLCATSVEESLRILKSHPVDIVLLDLSFNAASGTAFLQNAKKWLGPGKEPPPVVVLSGYKDPDIVNYALEMGAADFLAKPCEMSALVSTLKQHLH